MEDNNKNNQNQFQMGINPEVAEGIYSNLALITIPVRTLSSISPAHSPECHSRK